MALPNRSGKVRVAAVCAALGVANVTSKPTLPIAAFREPIVQTVHDNSLTIIQAETGAGKSTQVPQYLLDAGYSVMVCQPRRLAARTVAERVAAERGEQLGGTIGFRTAYERKDSRDTRCLFVTDGLALMLELMGQSNFDVLVIDEAHEWNLNIEVIIAWAKKVIAEGATFKVVIMSATIEAKELSAFCNNAPVISVPGRLFPVEEQEAGASIVDDVEKLVREGRNVLVFHPGKAEIQKLIQELERRRVNAEILPLHGQLSREEQDLCFRHYGRPKVVVSTNVAQTSVTIDDIDAVIDSGMERRTELDNGVEGLYLRPVSFADSKQRKGRAGRTKPGIYIDHCPADPRDRLAFPMAEILRTRLDQTVLRLAIAGLDAEELEFFHQPDKSKIHNARVTLRNLGCMTDEGRVTGIGRAVNRLPVCVQFARMIVEADRLGVVDDVLDIAAVLEQGGVTSRFIKVGEGRIPALPVWKKRFCPTEDSSDVMAQLAVFQTCVRERLRAQDMRDLGVFAKAFFHARDLRRKIASALRGKVSAFESSGNREDILRAVCAGMVDHLYRNEYGRYKNGEVGERELCRESVLRTAEWMVGIPWDLQIKTRRGPMTLRLVRMATKVDPKWLAEVAPQLAKKEAGLDPYYDQDRCCVVSTTRVTFNGIVISEEYVVDPNHPQAATIFADWLAAQMV
jgi:ATP-dependent helicase HrpB